MFNPPMQNYRSVFFLDHHTKQNKLQCLQNRKMCVWAESITREVKYEQVSSVLAVWGVGIGMNENVSLGAAGKAGMVEAMLFSLTVF